MDVKKGEKFCQHITYTITSLEKKTFQVHRVTQEKPK